MVRRYYGSRCTICDNQYSSSAVRVAQHVEGVVLVPPPAQSEIQGRPVIKRESTTGAHVNEIFKQLVVASVRRDTFLAL